MTVMPSGRRRGLLAGLLGLLAFGAVVAWFGIGNPRRADESPPSPAAALPPPEPGPAQARPEQSANLAQPQPQPQPPAAGSPEAARNPTAATPAAPGQAKAPLPEPGKPGGPSFDVVRVEPNGDTVIAGRGAPGATIEMMRNGKSHARAIADTSGLFAFVPPPLRPGSHEISLSATAPDGARTQSRDSVTVVINEDRATKPLVTLTSPDRPTVVLSAPEPGPKIPSGTDTPEVAALPPGASPPPVTQPSPPNGGPPAPRPGVKIGSVDAEEGGRLFVAGQAAPGATVRLYLNESFIAPGGTGNDGKFSFAIGRGVRPGDYRVRLDEVDPVSGEVKSRAEVAFNVPAPLTVPLPPHTQPHLPGSEVADAGVAGRTGEGTAGSAGAAMQLRRDAGDPDRPAAVAARAGDPARGKDPGTILVPEINTAMVARGDNLWSISRRIYGQGTRYTVIYDANQAQIRNPDRIYPGQMFVVPAEQPAPGAR
jgi:LysM domain